MGQKGCGAQSSKRYLSCKMVEEAASGSLLLLRLLRSIHCVSLQGNKDSSVSHVVKLKAEKIEKRSKYQLSSCRVSMPHQLPVLHQWMVIPGNIFLNCTWKGVRLHCRQHPVFQPLKYSATNRKKEWSPNGMGLLSKVPII